MSQVKNSEEKTKKAMADDGRFEIGSTAHSSVHPGTAAGYVNFCNLYFCTFLRVRTRSGNTTFPMVSNLAVQ